MSQTPQNPERVHRRRVQASQPELSSQPQAAKRQAGQSTRKSPLIKRLDRLWRRMPALLRIAIAGLLIVLFLTVVVMITRSYLAAQEERRRLEAEAAELAQHPLYFADWITLYAAEHGVDPALVAAVILCESSFNPQAESYLGARGLMQLMESTAGWVAEKLDEDGQGYSFDLLYEPQTNIRFGCWYLGYLSRRFDGDQKKIICAYHAGQGNVDAWLKNPAYSDDGVTLHTIPTEDTRAYYHRVSEACRVYQKYYFPSSQEQSDRLEGESTDAQSM